MWEKLFKGSSQEIENIKDGKKSDGTYITAENVRSAERHLTNYSLIECNLAISKMPDFEVIPNSGMIFVLAPLQAVKVELYGFFWNDGKAITSVALMIESRVKILFENPIKLMNVIEEPRGYKIECLLVNTGIKDENVVLKPMWLNPESDKGNCNSLLMIAQAICKK